MTPEEKQEHRRSLPYQYRRTADAYAHKAMMAISQEMREFYTEQELEYLRMADEAERA